MTSAVKRQAIEGAVLETYVDAHGAIRNGLLYDEVVSRTGLQRDLFEAVEPVGQSGQEVCLGKRDVRWAQQTLKVKGLIERVDRGRWVVTAEGRAKMHRNRRGKMLLGFSTRLGLAVWGDCRDVLGGLESEITLCLTSPCYPIHKGRNYGRISEQEYVDWLCGIMEGVAERLRPGGNVLLVLGQDIFEKGLPSRSLYLERLTIAMNDRLGLSLMDRLVWDNPSKAPGPIQWASKARIQLNVGYEMALWFCNDPANCVADNRRVLQPHSERHKRFLAKGGVQQDGVSSDGAHVRRAGRSFANVTEGRIPRNVLRYGHTCASQLAYKRRCKSSGLVAHGAPFPLALASMLVAYLSDQHGLVFDPFSGSGTTGLAAELQGRPWLMSEQYGEYVLGASTRFESQPEFVLNPCVLDILGLAA